MPAEVRVDLLDPADGLAYILRLWTATEPSPAVAEEDPIRGVVVEVATGRSSVFVGTAQLIALLRDAAASASTSAMTTSDEEKFEAALEGNARRREVALEEAQRRAERGVEPASFQPSPQHP